MLLPEELYGEAVRAVIRLVEGCSDETAMEVVDAVLGPMKLVSPMPDFHTPCDHRRFTYEGVWLACERLHGAGDSDPEFHGSPADEWYEHDPDGRSFSPKRRNR
jgi:hypothetical protein